MAHEVNWPIAATITSAQGTLRFLVAQTPDLEEIRRALGRIVRNADRARDLISGRRGLAQKVSLADKCLPLYSGGPDGANLGGYSSLIEGRTGGESGA